MCLDIFTFLKIYNILITSATIHLMLQMFWNLLWLVN